MVELIYLTSGVVIGGAAVAMLAIPAVNKLRAKVAELSSSSENLMLLRARIRAIQDRAHKLTATEAVYNVQQANGRFAKFTLPRV